MKRKRILPWVVLISHFLVILLVILDLLGLAMRHEVYAAVHGFDGGRQDWAQRSETNYVARNLVIIVVAGGGLFLSVRALRGQDSAARFLRIYAACVVLFMAYRVGEWWLSGFGWN